MPKIRGTLAMRTGARTNGGRAGRIRGRLTLRKTVVARVKRTRTTGAVSRLRLKANRTGRRRLKHHRKLRLTLVIDVTDSAGHTTTLARPVTLKVAKKR